MSIEDKITLGSLAIVAVVVGFLAYKVNKVVNNPDVQNAISEGSRVVRESVQTVRDVNTAITTGNAPPTGAYPDGTPKSQNVDDKAVSYLESVHDLVAHPVDSFKTLFGIGSN